MTILVERSNKGFSAERTLFATQIHCGFFTVMITQAPVIERIFKMLRLHYLMKSGTGPEEMACTSGDEADPGPDEMLNRFVRKSVPRVSVKIPRGHT